MSTYAGMKIRLLSVRQLNVLIREEMYSMVQFRDKEYIKTV